MLKKLLPAVVAAATLFGAATTASFSARGSSQKKSPRKPSATRRSGPAANAKPTPADASQSAPVTVTQLPSPEARPKVSEIDEAGLKALLGAGAGRARPLLVNFWATWCTPCREEFPDLVKLRGQYGAERLDFVIVSLDDPSDIGTAVPDFLVDVRATQFPSYLLHAADDSDAINYVDPTWSGELPATFLYDRAGTLVFKHKGRIKPDELRAALEQALADKPQQAATQK